MTLARGPLTRGQLTEDLALDGHPTVTLPHARQGANRNEAHVWRGLQVVKSALGGEGVEVGDCIIHGFWVGVHQYWIRPSRVLIGFGCFGHSCCHHLKEGRILAFSLRSVVCIELGRTGIIKLKSKCQRHAEYLPNDG